MTGRRFSDPLTSSTMFIVPHRVVTLSSPRRWAKSLKAHAHAVTVVGRYSQPWPTWSWLLCHCLPHAAAAHHQFSEKYVCEGAYLQIVASTKLLTRLNSRGENKTRKLVGPSTKLALLRNSFADTRCEALHTIGPRAHLQCILRKCLSRSRRVPTAKRERHTAMAQRAWRWSGRDSTTHSGQQGNEETPETRLTANGRIPWFASVSGMWSLLPSFTTPDGIRSSSAPILVAESPLARSPWRQVSRQELRKSASGAKIHNFALRPWTLAQSKASGQLSSRRQRT